MGIGGWIFLGLIAVVLVYGVMVYNGLVNLKSTASKSFVNIDVLLKQCHDELPKLVEICKRYMAYEQDMLIQIIEARSRVADAQQSGNVGALG